MSHTLGVLTISLFVAGFSVGPLLWAPLSEQVSPFMSSSFLHPPDVISQYGRKPVFIGTFVIYILTQVGNSLSRNAASILVFRMLGGIFAAAPVTNSGCVASALTHRSPLTDFQLRSGVVGDIWDAGTRGKAMAFFTVRGQIDPS